jgi:hypothetical protein
METDGQNEQRLSDDAVHDALIQELVRMMDQRIQNLVTEIIAPLATRITKLEHRVDALILREP